MRLSEATGPQVLVIYPGRFQPFHKGHRAVYDYLNNKYDNVYVATSDKVDPPRSPFSFAEKKSMMELTGMDTTNVVLTRNPYQAQEITQNFDAEKTILMFAVSEKDMAEDPRFAFKPKKDGSPSYFQPATDGNLETMDKHGYIITVPTFKFDVLGEPMKSATEFRSSFAKADEQTKKQMIQDLFGNYSDKAYNLMSTKITETQGSSNLTFESVNLDRKDLKEYYIKFCKTSKIKSISHTQFMLDHYKVNKKIYEGSGDQSIEQSLANIKSLTVDIMPSPGDEIAILRAHVNHTHKNLFLDGVRQLREISKIDKNHDNEIRMIHFTDGTCYPESGSYSYKDEQIDLTYCFDSSEKFDQALSFLTLSHNVISKEDDEDKCNDHEWCVFAIDIEESAITLESQDLKEAANLDTIISLGKTYLNRHGHKTNTRVDLTINPGGSMTFTNKNTGHSFPAKGDTLKKLMADGFETLKITRPEPATESINKNMAHKLGTFIKENIRVSVWETNGSVLLVSGGKITETRTSIKETVNTLYDKGYLVETVDIHTFINSAGEIAKILHDKITGDTVISSDKGRFDAKNLKNAVTILAKNKYKKATDIKKPNGQGTVADFGMKPKKGDPNNPDTWDIVMASFDNEVEGDEEELMASRTGHERYGYEKRKAKMKRMAGVNLG